MLKSLRNIVENPDEVPRIPVGVAEWIQAQLNGGYLMQTGVISRLKAEGYSEAFLAGFLAGAQYGCQIIDDADFVLQEQKLANQP